MKKLISYILLLILISFLIPILFTKRLNDVKDVSTESNDIYSSEKSNTSDDNTQNNGESKGNEEQKYSQYKSVKVLHTKTNTVEEMKLDEYLYGVVSAEMPASFEMEALKAQSIVARTYTLYKVIHNNGKHNEADICDSSDCCQAWISKDDRLNKWSESERESNWQKIVRICK